jgi:hypothetical protein
MVDKFLNFVDAVLVDPMCSPSVDQHEGLWPQIHGRILPIPVQPTKNHIRAHNINLRVGVGMWHQPNLVQACIPPIHMIRVVVCLYCVVATSRLTWFHHFLVPIAAVITTIA